MWIGVFLSLVFLFFSGKVSGEVFPLPPGEIFSHPVPPSARCNDGNEEWEPIEGRCYFPVDLLTPPGPLTFWVTDKNNSFAVTISVLPYPYPVQILSVPPPFVDLSPKDLRRVEKEKKQVEELWKIRTKRRFRLPLHPPVLPFRDGRDFGKKRIYNGEPRFPHTGVDFDVKEGTPVYASDEGKVVLVADHFFGGKSLFIDHGDGLITMYFHLKKILVKEGDIVRRGEVVALSGKTGRATGPHLHFGVRWRGRRVNPMTLLSSGDFSVP